MRHSGIYLSKERRLQRPESPVHLILNGFRNQKPGFFDIHLIAETGPGGAVETGSARVQILPRIRPSIEVTSAFNEGAPNTIYQQTTTGAATPLPYDFLLWDRNGDAFTGVTVQQVNSTHALLRRGRKTVGQVFIETPPGATGQLVSTNNASFAILAPISAVPTARLTVSFTAGSVPGDYTVTFRMNGGNSVQMFVTAS